MAGMKMEVADSRVTVEERKSVKAAWIEETGQQGREREGKSSNKRGYEGEEQS
jgi:hypothetical protein